MNRCLVRFIPVLLSLFLVFSTVSVSLAQKVPKPNYYNTPADYQRATGKRITKFGESPMLAELVKQGKLPPVDKRLPKRSFSSSPCRGDWTVWRAGKFIYQFSQ